MDKQNFNFLNVLALIAAFLFIFKPEIVANILPDHLGISININKKDLTVPEPDAQTKALLGNNLDVIKKEASSYQKSGISKSLLGDHFRDMTKFSLSNDKVVQSTSDVMNVNVRTQDMLFERFYPDRVKNQSFSDAANKAFELALGGLEVKQVTPEMRTQLVKVGNAIAWACYNGD